MLANASTRPRARRIHGCITTGVIALACLEPVTALAAASVTVDLATPYRPATHVASGFTYGVTEKLPADDDLERLVGALRPRMLTNPASSDPGTQQPGIPANAIKVAARVAPFGTTMTVRLADWFSGWYAFTTMTDWFSKIGATVAAKKAAKLDNIYAYEIWNEPNGSWTNGGDTNAVPGGNKNLSWNAFWKQSFDRLRQLDPAVKVTGPSLSYMDPDFMKGFLTYCKANDCLPDVIGWHEGVNIEADVSKYRDVEKQIGVGPLPITINEYSGLGRAKDEGRPGATVPLIAQLERSGVDSACVTWWLPDSIAGHMGSLLASDAETNGGWFLFKWYGEMSGNMVMTTPSLDKDGKNLDGVASLDASGRTVHVLLGGVSDGTIQVTIKGWKSAPAFVGKVHAVVERTRWTGRSGVVTSTETLSASDLSIVNDAVTVTIRNANADDGYRVSLTPLAGEVDAGAEDAGADGVRRETREAGVGGESGSGGRGGSMTMDAGRDGPAGGATRVGGSSGLGGAGGRGGGNGSATTNAGGMDAGATSASTAGGAGGRMSSAHVGGQAGSEQGGTTAVSSKTNGGGCACALSGREPAGAWGMLLLLASFALGRRARDYRKSRNPIHLRGNRLLYPPGDEPQDCGSSSSTRSTNRDEPTVFNVSPHER